jgi:putative peptidoglycan lipid II flippase
MGFAKSAAIFAVGTLGSRVTGLIRDRIVLAVFGASELHEAYVVANRIPNLLREMLAEGALSSSFTKVYTEVATKDNARALRLLRDALILITAIGTVVSVLGIFAAPYLVEASTTMTAESTYSDAFKPTTVVLTQLLFPFILFMAIGSIAMGALHKAGNFYLTSTSPILLNIGYIVGALVFAAGYPSLIPTGAAALEIDPTIFGLVCGVLLGGMGQMLYQLVGIRKTLKEAFSTISLPWSEDVAKVAYLMAPMIIATSAGPINAFVNLNFATQLGGGAVVWLNYAFRLLQLPIGLFGVAIGAAVLPTLTRQIVLSNGIYSGEPSKTMQLAIEIVLWLLIPATTFMLILSEPLMAVLFQSGRFQHSDVSATAACVAVYSLGMISYGLIKVVTSFYYSANNTKFPMQVSLSMIGVNFVANWLLAKPFGHLGIAGATALTIIGNSTFLLIGLRKYRLSWDRIAMFKSARYLLLATLAGAALAVPCRLYPDSTTVRGSALMLVAGGSLLVMPIVVAASRYWGFTLNDVVSRVRRRIAKK